MQGIIVHLNLKFMVVTFQKVAVPVIQHQLPAPPPAPVSVQQLPAPSIAPLRMAPPKPLSIKLPPPPPPPPPPQVDIQHRAEEKEPMSVCVDCQNARHCNGRTVPLHHEILCQLRLLPVSQQSDPITNMETTGASTDGAVGESAGGNAMFFCWWF